ncbi:MAG: ferredoxin [Patescibacteria group bacterium]|nr:ferredoxin [Patescibacteria group bacterium]
MDIFIDPKLCIGCGSCVIMAESVFTLDKKTGKAKLIKLPKEITKELKTAIESCPIDAIKIIE